MLTSRIQDARHCKTLEIYLLNGYMDNETLTHITTINKFLNINLVKLYELAYNDKWIVRYLLKKTLKLPYPRFRGAR